MPTASIHRGRSRLPPQGDGALVRPPPAAGHRGPRHAVGPLQLLCRQPGAAGARAGRGLRPLRPPTTCGSTTSPTSATAGTRRTRWRGLLATEELELEHDGAAGPHRAGAHPRHGRRSGLSGPEGQRVREPHARSLIARRCPARGGDAPELFAIPGTHDWYDGAGELHEIFCRERWIGGWRTRQRRSYFAIKLPHGWWLWGIDIQFGAAIDEVQLRVLRAGGRRAAAARRSGGGCARPRRSTAAASPTRSTPTATSRSSSARSSSPAARSCGCTSKSGKHYYSRYAGDRRASPAHRVRRRRRVPAPDAQPAARAQRLPRAQRRQPPTAGPARIRRPTCPSGCASGSGSCPPTTCRWRPCSGPSSSCSCSCSGCIWTTSHVDLGVGDLLRAMWESPTAFLLSLLVLRVAGRDGALRPRRARHRPAAASGWPTRRCRSAASPG